jgi:RNA polymerase sigma factor (sigma-70 family)
MRRRLVAYFDRKNCQSPDDLADETLTRVMRRLEEEGSILDASPARYCYIVAKYVFLEELRRPRSSEVDVEQFFYIPAPVKGTTDSTETDEDREELLNRLDLCLSKLDQQDRDLILEYYQEDQRAKIERRRSIAFKLGLTMNAVSIRACRIRNKLEVCLRNCSHKF